MGSGKLSLCIVSACVFALLCVEQRAHAEEEQGEADESAQEAETSDAEANDAETNDAETNDAETDEAEAADDQEDGDAEEQSGGQMGRRTLHMGPRNITGQWVRAGAIQLVRRTPRQLHELVSLRTTFRDRIVAPVYRAPDRP